MIRRAVSLPLAILTLAASLDATYSIIIIDTRTREIAIGSATCVPGFDLRRLSPVVLVGFGAAAAQSYVDTSGANRLLIRGQLQRGTAPSQILSLLAQRDPSHQTRQYGIVDRFGRAIGFTGNQAGPFAGDITGTSGTLVWAIQGNVITGLPVLKKAEEAIRKTPGDLAAKLMAAMEAGRLMGGDGRCSCCPTNATKCGSPPRNFTKAADIGYMIVARLGDKDGGCNSGTGCASGTYYMNHNIAFAQRRDKDPVLQLKELYDKWRSSWTGRPDHHLSTITLSSPTLPADGRTTVTATLVLRDWRGEQLTNSQGTVLVSLGAGSTATVAPGTVSAKGNGVFTFPVTAGKTPGTALLEVVVNDGQGFVLLSPSTPVTLTAEPLWVSTRSLSAATGGIAGFALQGRTVFANRPYLLLGSSSGSSPGIRVSRRVVIPVNPDATLLFLLQIANSPFLPGAVGALDAEGRGAAFFLAPAGALTPLLGTRLTFAWATLAPIDFASNPASIGIGL